MKTEQIEAFVHKRDKPFFGGEAQPAAFHSRNYHRFFEDWAEVQRTDENGHPVIERVYAGTWYVHPLEKKERFLLLAGYFLVWILASALFIWGAAQPVEVNSKWYVTIFEAITAGALFWMLVSLCNYAASPLRLTINGYRSSSVNLRHSAITAAIVLSLAAAAVVIWNLTNIPVNDSRRWLCAAAFLLSAVLCFVINRIEAKIIYDEIPADQVPPEGSIIIE